MADNINEKLINLIDASIALASEKNYDTLLEKILRTAIKITNADGGTLYVMRGEDRLHFNIIMNNSLDIYIGGASGKVISFPPLQIINEDTGTFNKSNAATYVAITKEPLSIIDVYDTTEFDFQGAKKFDEANGYRTKSLLMFPLKNKDGKVIAVIQLINALDDEGQTVPFDALSQLITNGLAAQATIVLEYQNLVTDQNRFMESFIEIVAEAIDKRSPYTSAHCQRVPILSKMLATAATMDKEGALKDFELSDDQWYAFHIASWLHDCGKVITPEHIMDKATKLECIYNRIHEVRTRFEVLKRDLHIEYLKKRLEDKEDKQILVDNYNNQLALLYDDFAFVAKCNRGDSPLSDGDVARLKKISGYKFKRYFDITLGLSRNEEIKYKSEIPSDEKLPVDEYLLQDAKHHIDGRFNYGELYNLLIKQGTLTQEERQILNEHVELTREMLEKIPFPEEIKYDIVEYASNHHEKLDGTGYMRGLKAQSISLPARIMAIADNFESLTATDRPFRDTKSLSQALSIMDEMRNDQFFDSDLFDLFLESKIPLEYANEYMRKEQIDIDENDLIKYKKYKE